MFKMTFLPSGGGKPFTIEGTTVQTIFNQLPDRCPKGADLKDLSVLCEKDWVPADEYAVRRGLSSPFELSSL